VSDFHLQSPWWLLLLVPLGCLAVHAARRRTNAAILYSEVSLLSLLPETRTQRWQWIVPWIGVLGIALLIAAMARPQCGQEQFRVRAEGIAILVCLDRSGSMQEPFEGGQKRVSRLEAARRVFHDFVEGRTGDQIGLVTFTGFVEDKCPLTLDHDALLRLLEDVKVTPPPSSPDGAEDPRAAEERLTAIGDAVATAVVRLKGAKAKSRIIILLSDGVQTAGVVRPSEAAKAAKALGIKIYAISLRDSAGSLKDMAEATGGRSFCATDAGALAGVSAEIDRQETSVVEGRLYTQYRELYPFAMFPGLGLVLLEVVLVSTRLRRLP